MPGEMRVDLMALRYPNERIVNFNVWENQRLDLGVAQIKAIEAGCGITGKNPGRIDRGLSPVRLFRVGLNNVERIETLQILQVLLPKVVDRSVAKNFEPRRGRRHGGQVRLHDDVDVERTCM